MSIISKIAAVFAAKPAPKANKSDLAEHYSALNALPRKQLLQLSEDEQNQIETMFDDGMQPSDIAIALQLHPQTIYSWKRHRYKPKQIMQQQIHQVDPAIAQKKAAIELLKLESEEQQLKAKLDAEKNKLEIENEDRKLDLEIKKVELEQKRLELAGDDEDEEPEEQSLESMLMNLITNAQKLQAQRQAAGQQQTMQQYGYPTGAQAAHQVTPPVSPAPPATPSINASNAAQPQKRLEDDQVTDAQIEDAVNKMSVLEKAAARRMSPKKLRSEIVARFPVSEQVAERVAARIKA